LHRNLSTARCRRRRNQSQRKKKTNLRR
jgi:hypothetical protein